MRELADELRARLLSASPHSHEMALSFALAREAARRHVGMRHFHVQLLGGAAMMGGALAEMETGEGKTLTALLPAVAAALVGRPVHVMTVNDYLARRDAEQMAPVYQRARASPSAGRARPAAAGAAARLRRATSPIAPTRSSCSIICATGWRSARAAPARGSSIDELFKTGSPARRQRLLLRGLHFAIVDEADSVLIDEARTPLILSGRRRCRRAHGLYETALDIARRLALGEDFQLLANEKTCG